MFSLRVYKKRTLKWQSKQQQPQQKSKSGNPWYDDIIVQMEIKTGNFKG